LNDSSTVEVSADKVETPPVLLLPGHLFFVDRIELPDELEGTDLAEFAEISLEAIAPFPIDQLYWGFISSESADALLLYAASKDRVHKLGFTELESYIWVLADFATLHRASFAEETRVRITTSDSATCLTYQAGETLPRSVDSATVREEPRQEEIETAHLFLRVESVSLSEQGLPTFRFLKDEGTTDAASLWQEVSPSEASLWQADVRNAVFKVAERNNRRMTKWVTRATGYTLLLLLLLLALEGVLHLGNFWLDRLDSKIAGQAPEVIKIEDKQSLMLKLDQVAQNELRPIAILRALNRTRPDGIFFTDAIAEGQNRIRIEGVANTINELNTYVESLEASGNFDLQEQETNFRDGKTSFRVSLGYTHENIADKTSMPEEPSV